MGMGDVCAGTKKIWRGSGTQVLQRVSAVRERRRRMSLFVRVGINAVHCLMRIFFFSCVAFPAVSILFSFLLLFPFLVSTQRVLIRSSASCRYSFLTDIPFSHTSVCEKGGGPSLRHSGILLSDPS